MPFWVIVIARVWLKEKMRPLQWAAIGLAFAGLLGMVDPGARLAAELCWR